MAELTYNQVAKIKVFGVGGAGSNAVNRMVQEGVQGVEFYIANTDLQAMDISPVANKIQLGKEGLGAGGNPDNGRKAAVESEDAIRKSMEGADMVSLQQVWVAELVQVQPHYSQRLLRNLDA